MIPNTVAVAVAAVLANQVAARRLSVKLLMENWRKFLAEELSGSKAVAYHGSRTPPEQFPKILKAWKSGGGSGKKQYGDGAYLVLDDSPDSKTLKGAYGEHIYRLEVDLTGFIIFEPEAAKEVHGANTSIAAQLRKMGKPEVVEELKAHLSSKAAEQDAKDDASAQAGNDYNVSKEFYSWAHNPLSVDGKLDTELGPDGGIKAHNAMAQEYSSVLEKHVDGILFAAGSENNRVIAVYKPEIIVPLEHAVRPTWYKGPLGPEVPEEWLKKQATAMGKGEDWEPNEYMLDRAAQLGGLKWEPLQ